MAKLQTYPLLPQTSLPENALKDSPDKALILEQNGRIVGVFVAPDEYNSLRAVYDLVKSTNGISKISGTYKPEGETLSLEDVFARR
jgi:hypothetical protein